MVATLKETMELPFPMLKDQCVVNPDDVPSYSKDEYEYPLLLSQTEIDQQKISGSITPAAQLPLDLGKLTAAHIGKLIHDNRLCHAFRLEEDGLSAMRATKCALLVKNDSDFLPSLQVYPPGTSVDVKEETYFTQTKATSQETVSFSAKIEGTYEGISPSAYAANSYTSDTSSMVSSGYAVSSIIFSSLEFSKFDAKSGPFEINPEMIAASKKVNTIDDANTFFNDWGFSMPSQFTLGQMVSFSKKITFNHEMSKEDAKAAGGVAIKSAVVSAETQAAKTDTYSKDSTNASTAILSTVMSNAAPAMLAPEKSYELGNFRHDPSAWKQCNVMEFVPILSLLEPTERDMIEGLIRAPRMKLYHIMFHAGDHWGLPRNEGMSAGIKVGDKDHSPYNGFRQIAQNTDSHYPEVKDLPPAVLNLSLEVKNSTSLHNWYYQATDWFKPRILQTTTADQVYWKMVVAEDGRMTLREGDIFTCAIWDNGGKCGPSYTRDGCLSFTWEGDTTGDYTWKCQTKADTHKLLGGGTVDILWGQLEVLLPATIESGNTIVITTPTQAVAYQRLLTNG
jgi:hypothetical protein